MKISAIVMASGLSRRMGKNKLLLPYKGKTLIELMIDKVLSCDFYQVNIVTAYKEIESMYSAIIKSKSIKNVILTKNKAPEIGISESIKLGVKKLGSCDAYMFFVSDQPSLSTQTIGTLLAEFEKGKIIVPSYKGKNGSPVIFSSSFKNELLSLEGDAGGKQVLEKHKDKIKYIEINNPEEGYDIDTKEDYESLMLRK